MQRPIIVKLGGSIITNKKGGVPRVQKAVALRLARMVAETREPLILLHGAGSFGHPLAHKYKLSGRALSIEVLRGVGETTASVRALGNALVEVLLSAGVPVVPVQTSSCVYERKGELIFTNLAFIETILKNGGVPLLGGDGVIADSNRIEIASADRLAVTLAQHFKSKHIIFATDVDGVYATFPPKKDERPLATLSRRDLSYVATGTASKKDVTGAMGGKLQALLPLRKCIVTIVNGLTPGTLALALRRESVGTRIAL